MSTVLLHMAWP